MGLVVSGASLIDGRGEKPTDGQTIHIEGDRITRVDSDLGDSLGGCEVVDARGKFVVPGLMDANVHLLGDVRLEHLVRYEERFEDLIAEAAQVALRAGLTTVFDTWGPRRHLTAIRDKIATGEIPGSRIFCAGNIIGLNGPFSADFHSKTADVASSALVERVNSVWVENVGPELSWMTPERVAGEVRSYIGKQIDFVKYASSEHRWGDPSAFLLFSPAVQAKIVEEAHRAGLTAQAHTTAVEALRAAIVAGCDLIQHCNITGPVAIPGDTLDLIAKQRTGAVVFAFTQRRFDWIMKNCQTDSRYFAMSDLNCRKLLESGANILMAGDGCIFGQDVASDPWLGQFWCAPGEDNLCELGQGHFHWLRAMEEKGMRAIEILRAATLNVARAYGKDQDLGTLEPGKIADMVILNKNPLESADNYRDIYMIIKDGVLVERNKLPQHPILTCSVNAAIGPSPSHPRA